jgi:prepilin signal peptidase PulO-like enzyme (type II secretory pathway)
MWVTQALPFIVYIGAGFAALLVLGDLLAVLIALFS